MWIPQAVQCCSLLQPVLQDLLQDSKGAMPLRSWCRHCPSQVGWLQPIQDPEDHGAHWLLLSYCLGA